MGRTVSHPTRDFLRAYSSLPSADRRVVHDLDSVAVRVAQVERPSPVSMRPRARRQRHALPFEVRGPGVHVVSRPHDQTQMVQRRAPNRVGRRPVQRQVVGAGGEIGIVWVRLPLDVKSKNLRVETLRLGECPYEQREVTKTHMRGRTVGHAQW